MAKRQGRGVVRSLRAFVRQLCGELFERSDACIVIARGRKPGAGGDDTYVTHAEYKGDPALIWAMLDEAMGAVEAVTVDEAGGEDGDEDED